MASKPIINDNENSCQDQLNNITVRTAENDKLPFLEAINTYADKFFPDCLHKTYRVPAKYFPTEKLKKTPEYEEEVPVEDATVRGDEAEMRFCDSLESMKTFSRSDEEEPMMIITGFKFENYLSKLKSEIDAGRIGKPAKDCSHPFKDGQHDVLLLHLKHGVTFFEVKGIGEFKSDPAKEKKKEKRSRDNHSKSIKNHVVKGIEQLKRNETFFDCIMKDLNFHLPVNKIIVLPNLSRTTLNKVEATKSVLEFENMFDSCICADEIPSLLDEPEIHQEKLQNLNVWWKNNITNKGFFKTVDDYKQVVGRY